ncbi:hypothetical protein PHMEG_00030198 [Phytophthora megakarya]|uniref:Uncharacterized protein n=1 Tax=Phytophthora megakarya TaxID=4795 RepID=A0A225V3C2_9STRA|nr:hypothetical protein PHMEG_00030198 [Phytophthora megakarya]
MDKVHGHDVGTREDEEQHGKLIGSVKKGKRFWKGKQQKNVGGGKKIQSGNKFKETRRCHHCNEVRQLRASCKIWQAEKKTKEQQTESDDEDEDDRKARRPRLRKTRLKGLGHE